MTSTTSLVYLKAADVKARYGNVSDMWLHRRLTDKSSDFPKPVYFGRRRHWNVEELERWERSNLRMRT